MKKLEFEYCECGCKCSSAGSKGIYYSLYNDLKGNYTLRRGHGHYGHELGIFQDYKKAVETAQKDWDEQP